MTANLNEKLNYTHCSKSCTTYSWQVGVSYNETIRNGVKWCNSLEAVRF